MTGVREGQGVGMFRACVFIQADGQEKAGLCLSALPSWRVATREESGVLGFPSRRGLTPRGSLECNPEIPAFPGEEN